MRRFWKWCGVPALLAAALVLAADDGQGQQFQVRQPGGAPGAPPGGGMDPDAMWNMMSKGQDRINLNDPANAWMKSMREKRGQAIPPDGVLTKDMFKTEYQQRMAQGSGFSGKSGRDGGFGGRGGFGGPPGMTSAPGAPPVVIQGGPGGFPAPAPGGAPGADSSQMFESMFLRSDKNGDGRITMDEASDRLRGSFALYDKNGDGAIDRTEFAAYMTDRMSNGGRGGPGGPGNFGGPSGTNPFQPGFPPQAGNWQGGPPPGDWSQNRDDRSGRDKRRGEEEEDPRPVVYRYGKLPKEIPDWFEKLDTDHDGMVGLYEWRRAGRKTETFVEMDLNGDGYLTADEWLRFSKLQLEKKPGDDDEEGGGTPTISRYSSGGPPSSNTPGGPPRGLDIKGKGGDGKGGPNGFGNFGKGDKGGRDKGGDKGGRDKGGEKGGVKRNPFTGG